MAGLRVCYLEYSRNGMLKEAAVLFIQYDKNSCLAYATFEITKHSHTHTHSHTENEKESTTLLTAFNIFVLLLIVFSLAIKCILFFLSFFFSLFLFQYLGVFFPSFVQFVGSKECVNTTGCHFTTQQTLTLFAYLAS